MSEENKVDKRWVADTPLDKLYLDKYYKKRKSILIGLQNLGLTPFTYSKQLLPNSSSFVVPKKFLLL